MSAALSRRGALRGSLAASLGLAAGVAPVLAAPVAIDSDAVLIAFAGRVERLVRKCNASSERQSDIADEVSRTLGFPPHAEEFDTRAAWEAACEAHERAEKAMEARLGLPNVERRFDRMWSRLHRWCAQLAGMHPQTLAGLAAKAGPLSAIGKRTVTCGNWGQVDEYAHALAITLAHDTVRLGRGGAA